MFGLKSAGPLRGHQAVEALDLVETWLTLYLSLHVYFTALIHAVSNTGRGLEPSFTLTCQGSVSSASPQPSSLAQSGQPSPALRLASPGGLNGCRCSKEMQSCSQSSDCMTAGAADAAGR